MIRALEATVAHQSKLEDVVGDREKKDGESGRDTHLYSLLSGPGSAQSRCDAAMALSESSNVRFLVK